MFAWALIAWNKYTHIRLGWLRNRKENAAKFKILSIASKMHHLPQKQFSFCFSLKVSISCKLTKKRRPFNANRFEKWKWEILDSHQIGRSTLNYLYVIFVCAQRFAFKQRELSEFTQKYGNYLVLCHCGWLCCCCYSKHNLKLTKPWSLESVFSTWEAWRIHSFIVANVKRAQAHTLHVHLWMGFELKSGIGWAWECEWDDMCLKLCRTKVEMSLYRLYYFNRQQRNWNNHSTTKLHIRM